MLRSHRHALQSIYEKRLCVGGCTLLHTVFSRIYFVKDDDEILACVLTELYFS